MKLLFYILLFLSPFWSKNQPGNLWNCKCDWEETDDNPTDGNPTTGVSAKGLDGNPALTGQVFTDRCSYMQRAGKEAIQEVAKCYFPDNKSKLQISVMPDVTELNDNIRTGRILSKTEDVKIRPHFPQETGKAIKNPEYEINGLIADAKRIKSAKGVTSGFCKAIKQGCKAVIIDIEKNSVKLDASELSKFIARRKLDFTSGKIKFCYVVFNGRYVSVNPITMDRPQMQKVIEQLKP